MQPFASQTEYENEQFKKITHEGDQIRQREFYDCVFSHCSLRETGFNHCKFTDCIFEDCDLSLIGFTGSSLNDIIFRRCQMIGVNWALVTWSQFQSESPVRFDECNLDFATFIGLSLRKLRMTGCSAKEVEFAEADLSGADFSGTDLAQSRFRHTNLTQANFVGAANYTIDIATSNIAKAKFSLPEALSLLYGLDIVLVE